MPSEYSVVLTKPEHVEKIKKRLSKTESVTTVSEADLLQVQDMLLERKPSVVVLHSAFAATSRGATLVAALKATDAGTSIRVFIEDDEKPLILTETKLPPDEVLLETSRPLERAGTRQAARYPMNRSMIAVNGEAGHLIDLSVSGAQVQTVFRLRPLKVAKLVIPEGSGDIRIQGTVAWAIAVPAKAGIQYRAGIEFVNADKQQLSDFCAKHGDAPDPTLGKTEEK